MIIKWSWTSDVLRTADNLLSVKVTKLAHRRKHSRGRQIIRGYDEIRKFACIILYQLAHDSGNWRSLGEAFISFLFFFYPLRLSALQRGWAPRPNTTNVHKYKPGTKNFSFSVAVQNRKQSTIAIQIYRNMNNDNAVIRHSNEHNISIIVTH